MDNWFYKISKTMEKRMRLNEKQEQLNSNFREVTELLSRDDISNTEKDELKAESEQLYSRMRQVAREILITEHELLTGKND